MSEPELSGYCEHEVDLKKNGMQEELEIHKLALKTFLEHIANNVFVYNLCKRKLTVFFY